MSKLEVTIRVPDSPRNASYFRHTTNMASQGQVIVKYVMDRAFQQYEQGASVLRGQPAFVQQFASIIESVGQSGLSEEVVNGLLNQAVSLGFSEDKSVQERVFVLSRVFAMVHHCYSTLARIQIDLVLLEKLLLLSHQVFDGQLAFSDELRAMCLEVLNDIVRQQKDDFLKIFFKSLQ